MAAPTTATASAEQFAERLFTSALGTIDMLSIYIGDRLGWYRILAADGPLTAPELASSTGTAERYAREWLEQQATAGLIEVAEDSLSDDAAAADARSYRLPPGAAEVLTDQDSLNYLAPLARMLGGTGPFLPELLEAYRTGGGVSWQRFGDDARESQGAINRPLFERELPTALASVPEINDTLGRDGARVADVACGLGWSTIAMARAYPHATFVGIDIDGPSIDAARMNAEQAGLSDRVTFEAADAGGLDEPDSFDAAFVFEALHDMPQPVEVLRAIRSSVRPDGVVVVMDEAVADRFEPNGSEVDRLMYGFSLLVCLPDGMSSPGSVGTGTVMRPSTLELYAREAGFASIEVLPIEDFAFFRFYRLKS